MQQNIKHVIILIYKTTKTILAYFYNSNIGLFEITQY